MKNNCLRLNLLFFIMTVSMQASAVQDVYEYTNKQGVVEFTDEIKADKKPDKHLQIKKMTPEEEALGEQKLEKIMEKDKELDKRLARERQLENERKRQYQEQQALKKKQQPEQEDDGISRRNNRNLYPRPVQPGRPGIRPPKPSHPIQPPGKPPGRPGNRPAASPR